MAWRATWDVAGKPSSSAAWRVTLMMVWHAASTMALNSVSSAAWSMVCVCFVRSSQHARRLALVALHRLHGAERGVEYKYGMWQSSRGFRRPFRTHANGELRWRSTLASDLFWYLLDHDIPRVVKRRNMWRFMNERLGIEEPEKVWRPLFQKYNQSAKGLR